MIIEFFLDIWAGVVDWFMSLFGTDAPPQWLQDFGGFVAEVFARAAGLGAWFPFALFATVAGFYYGSWAVFWLIKGVRWLWGLTPFSGGS